MIRETIARLLQTLGLRALRPGDPQILLGQPDPVAARREIQHHVPAPLAARPHQASQRLPRGRLAEVDRRIAGEAPALVRPDHLDDLVADYGVGEELPFADESFDSVFSAYVFRNLDSVDRTMEEVARVLLELRVIFLTHLHADHHLGSVRILYERDLLMRKLPAHARTPIYVCLPFPVREWLQRRVEDHCAFPELVLYLNHEETNPEPHRYYEVFDLD